MTRRQLFTRALGAIGAAALAPLAGLLSKPLIPLSETELAASGRYWRIELRFLGVGQTLESALQVSNDGENWRTAQVLQDSRAVDFQHHMLVYRATTDALA
jgi:hypothetical protein